MNERIIIKIGVNEVTTLKSEKFVSFDGTEKFQINVSMPDRYSNLFRDLNKSNRPYISRGAGLSFCAASGLHGGTTINTKYFNRILSFDSEKGLVTVEPGITVGKLHAFCVDRGWIMPVIPGHPKITIGGCAAFNVHGKSQFHNGIFIDHVEAFKLYHPAYGELICNRNSNSDIFDLTIGGFGLTGFITEITLKLNPFTGKSLEITKVPVLNLLHAVEVMEANAEKVDVLYSWNDLNIRGKKFGKGIAYLEKFSSECCRDRYKERSLSSAHRGILGINFFNNLSVKLMTTGYGLMEQLSASKRIMDIKTATFPINGKEIYYHLFGKTGFREYQFIVSRDNWPLAVKEVEKVISKHKISATLGSLKLFKGNTKYLNFSGTGICLAIDVPANTRSICFFEDLDNIVSSLNGIVNLSKDSRISRCLVQKLYPEYDTFVKQMAKYDSEKYFDSELRRRIGV